jgi:hypothetical protein
MSIVPAPLKVGGAQPPHRDGGGQRLPASVFTSEAAKAIRQLHSDKQTEAS